MAIWDPSQIAAQNIDCERGSHEDSAYPEAPITMHPPPVRTGIGLPTVVAIALHVVLASRHFVSICRGIFATPRSLVAARSMIQSLLRRHDVGFMALPNL
jgi:hypothetical protein